jgi:hypothetical protein
MKNLQEATERICELKGSLVAMNALLTAMLQSMPDTQRRDLLRHLSENAEVARTVLLHTTISELTIASFEHDVQRMSDLLDARPASGSGQT